MAEAEAFRGFALGELGGREHDLHRVIRAHAGAAQVVRNEPPGAQIARLEHAEAAENVNVSGTEGAEEVEDDDNDDGGGDKGGDSEEDSS